MNALLRTRRLVDPGLVLMALAAALALVAAVTFSARPAAAQDEVTVQIVDFAFDPASIEVAAGTTVVFTNAGEAPHTATADDGSFDTGELGPGDSASVTFDTPGTYTFFCAVHPNMTGTIVVTGGEDDGGEDDGGEDDGGDDGGDAGTGGTGAAALPSSGTGAAFGAGGASMLTVGLLALAGMLALTGLTLHRRAAR